VRGLPDREKRHVPGTAVRMPHGQLHGVLGGLKVVLPPAIRWGKNRPADPQTFQCHSTPAVQNPHDVWPRDCRLQAAINLLGRSSQLKAAVACNCQLQVRPY
jgi:hypothetical protein